MQNEDPIIYPLDWRQVMNDADKRVGISTRFRDHLPSRRSGWGLLCRQRARPSDTLDKSRIQFLVWRIVLKCGVNVNNSRRLPRFWRCVSRDFFVFSLDFPQFGAIGHAGTGKTAFTT